MKVALVVLLVAIGIANCDDSSVTASSAAGVFQGTIIQSRKGRDIYAFKGIKYAEAPVDDLRFQPPVLITSYKDVVNATVDGPLCAGTSPAAFENTSEDCLMVNVYVPKIESSTLLPVIVYIRGGAFVVVSGRSVISGPQYLLDQDVVLVTFNYRTGFLGFLSTGDELVPGNNGLKDQVALLQWVKNNIEGFGGNPDSVTLLGDDAGALSIGLHMVSPLVPSGLFHRVILSGGSPTGQWDLPSNQLALAAKKAHLLGCESSTSAEIVACLKAADFSEFYNKDSELYEFAQQDPFWLYKPVIEADFGQERFITENPTNSFAAGKAKDVPVLIGVTELMNADHGYVVAYNETFREQLIKNWAKLAPLVFELDKEDVKAVSPLRKAYLRGVDLASASEDELASRLGDIYADAITGFSVYRLTKLLASTISSPIYTYKFNYTGTSSWYTSPITGSPIGAVSRDDFIYIVQSSNRFTPIGTSGNDAAMVDVMTTLLVNFAINSDPNPTEGQTAISSVEWPAYTTDATNFLQINSPTDIASSSNVKADKYTVWEKLFPISMKNY